MWFLFLKVASLIYGYGVDTYLWFLEQIKYLVNGLQAFLWILCVPCKLLALKDPYRHISILYWMYRAKSVIIHHDCTWYKPRSRFSMWLQWTPYTQKHTLFYRNRSMYMILPTFSLFLIIVTVTANELSNYEHGVWAEIPRMNPCTCKHKHISLPTIFIPWNIQSNFSVLNTPIAHQKYTTT
jgi:hypothetical protein